MQKIPKEFFGSKKDTMIEENKALSDQCFFWF
jgi:hypothetical protein